MSKLTDDLKLQSVNKFYLLEYFYILLKSIKANVTFNDVLTSFIKLKISHKLGESKYRKLTFESDVITDTQAVRYTYTMNQVISESLQYGLITQNDAVYRITDLGEELINLYDNGDILDYNFRVFYHMEHFFLSFKYHLEFCELTNPKNNGLLLFPMYSPLKLGISRNELQTAGDIERYIDGLCNKISFDIQDNIQQEVVFAQEKIELVQKLHAQGLISRDEHDKFNPLHYNVILKRIRDYLIKVILNKVYKYRFSFTAFDIWMYRAKQIGVLYATEFFPSNSGRVIYPTSIIAGTTKSTNVKKLYTYDNGESLYIHIPDVNDMKMIDNFVNCLIESYLDIRGTVRNYYISLPDLRELVCFKQRIPSYVFDSFLDKTYKLMLAGELPKLRISLEADKLPYETNAMYLKREPSRIDGNLRNIIGINMSGGCT